MTITFDTFVFVFGSNLAGRHGAGAAKFAREWRGAEPGIGVGLRGQSYALPTKGRSLEVLPLSEIKEHVDAFKAVAARRQDLRFQVTRVGCGLAGYQDTDIAPLFDAASENVMLPGVWHKLLGKKGRRRVIVGGAREGVSRRTVFESLDALLPAPNDTRVLVVSNGERGAATYAEEWAASRLSAQQPPFLRVDANWPKYQKVANQVRDSQMVWYATDLILFSVSPLKESASLVAQARNNGLQTQVVGIENPRLF